MQTMSTDPQTYYQNPGGASHQPANAYYIQNTGMDPRK